MWLIVLLMAPFEDAGDCVDADAAECYCAVLMMVLSCMARLGYVCVARYCVDDHVTCVADVDVAGVGGAAAGRLALSFCPFRELYH